MKLILTFLPIFLLLSMSVARPAHRNSSNENELESRLKKTDCVKIRNLKKSVYNYLESKLANLNSSQQELLAKKLIAKLNRHFLSRRGHPQSQGPWTDNGEIFARMLKWKAEKSPNFPPIFLCFKIVEWSGKKKEEQIERQIRTRREDKTPLVSFNEMWKILIFFSTKINSSYFAHLKMISLLFISPLKR